MSALEDIRNYPNDSPKFKAAIVTLRQSNRTQSALEEVARVRVSHIRHTKGGCDRRRSDTDRVFAELIYECFLKPRWHVASSEYDNLHIAAIDKTFECSMLASAKEAARESFARKTPYTRPSYT
jgi:hypothetical protein